MRLYEEWQESDIDRDELVNILMKANPSMGADFARDAVDVLARAAMQKPSETQATLDRINRRWARP